MKRNVFFGLLVIALVFGFVGCDSGSSSGGGGNTIPSEVQGTWKWERGEGYAHVIVLEIGNSTIKEIVTDDPDTSKNGTRTLTVTNVIKESFVSPTGWRAYSVEIKGMGFLPFQLNATKALLSENSSTPNRIYYKQSTDKIPCELQGIWKWKAMGSDHTIVFEIGSSTIKETVTDDPDTSKNGISIFTVTDVTKGSTSGVWTTYTVAIAGMGNFDYRLDNHGSILREPIEIRDFSLQY